MEKYNATLFLSHGAVMKGYVEIPDDMLKDINKLKKYLEMGHAYVKSLEHKPTTKKKKNSLSARLTTILKIEDCETFSHLSRI